MRTVFGLDPGVNSIGWAVVSEREKNVPVDLKDGGARIFQEATDAKTRRPKNQQRRNARLTRRVIQRRARRKKKLRNYLISIGWLPDELRTDAQAERWFNAVGDAYSLRKKGLDEPLSRQELSRVLLHYCARRGFLSNRKTTLIDLYRSGDPDVAEVLFSIEGAGEDVSEYLSEAALEEDTAFKKEIADLQNDIKNSGSRTLGEYLAGLSHHERKRTRRTERRMYEYEFDLLWKTQAQFDPDALTDRVRFAIHECIFFQRPLKLRKDRRGRCSLEPSRYRAMKARIEVQEFRLLQDINYLRYEDMAAGEWKLLDPDQRAALLAKLQHQHTMTWSAAKKILGLNSRVRLNLEESKRSIAGNRTVAKVRNVEPEFWDGLNEEYRLALIEDLLTIKDRYALYGRLVKHWGLSVDKAIAYSVLEFEPGVAGLSLKAIRKLLPLMRRGMNYADARVELGYGYEVPAKGVRDRLGEPPEVGNPVVKKCLYEVRKLVNAMIREHGKPDAIRIELARDLKRNEKQRLAIQKQNRLNEKANIQATEQYGLVREQYPHLSLKEHPSSTDLLRYRLWRESDERCPYSGKTISLAELWSSSIEVDHILPFSRSLDNSYMNKVVCLSNHNREKGNRTPFEAWGGEPEDFQAIAQRCRPMPRAKFRRMTCRKLDKVDDFISRQLNDTSYISRLVFGYLSSICEDVSVSTGGASALLRRQWGLNNILSETGEKTRSDHRHHLVDAVVVALTNRATYRKIATLAGRLDADGQGNSLSRLKIDEPIPGLRKKVEALCERTVVSHAINRKLTGALHEDTIRGLHVSGCITRRLPVNAQLTAKNISNVVDPSLRTLLEKHLETYQGDAKKAFSEPLELEGGHVLRRVKVISAKQQKPGAYLEIEDRSGSVQRRMNFGNLHHVELFRDEKGKAEPKFVTTYEAARRAREERPIVQTTVEPDCTFLYALHINDTVEVDVDSGTAVYRVQKLERDSKVLTLRLHSAATLDVTNEMIRKSARRLVDDFNMRLVTVDVLGRVVSRFD